MITASRDFAGDWRNVLAIAVSKPGAFLRPNIVYYAFYITAYIAVGTALSTIDCLRLL